MCPSKICVRPHKSGTNSKRVCLSYLNVPPTTPDLRSGPLAASACVSPSVPPHVQLTRRCCSGPQQVRALTSCQLTDRSLSGTPVPACTHIRSVGSDVQLLPVCHITDGLPEGLSAQCVTSCQQWKYMVLVKWLSRVFSPVLICQQQVMWNEMCAAAAAAAGVAASPRLLLIKEDPELFMRPLLLSMTRSNRACELVRLVSN